MLIMAGAGLGFIGFVAMTGKILFHVLHIHMHQQRGRR